MPERRHASSARGIAAVARTAAGATRQALAAAATSRAAGVLVADCLQCGRDRVDIIRLGRGHARVSCRACGAVTVQDRSRLHQPPARARPDASPPAYESRPSQRLHSLAPYVSADLLAWARETGRDRQITTLGKAVIYRLWKEFDRRDGECSLPAIGEVVSLLHARCYDEALVVAELVGRESEPRDAAAIAERVGCARRWLAGPGREHCWIERRAGKTGEEAVVRSLLEEAALEGPLDGTQRAALHAAAFGATGGPAPGMILRRFDANTIARALETHLLDGSHPLRETVLAALDGGRVAGYELGGGPSRC